MISEIWVCKQTYLFECTPHRGHMNRVRDLDMSICNSRFVGGREVGQSVTWIGLKECGCIGKGVFVTLTAGASGTWPLHKQVVRERASRPVLKAPDSINNIRNSEVCEREILVCTKMCGIPAVNILSLSDHFALRLADLTLPLFFQFLYLEVSNEDWQYWDWQSPFSDPRDWV